MAFLVSFSHVLQLGLWATSSKSVHFLLTKDKNLRNIKRGQTNNNSRIFKVCPLKMLKSVKMFSSKIVQQIQAVYQGFDSQSLKSVIVHEEF